MTILVSNEAEVTLLGAMLGYTTPGNQILRLFANNTVVSDSDVAATFTEMSTHGYAAKTLAKGSWTIASSGGVGTATYAQQTWTFSAASPVTVYGYYVTDATTGKLLWAENFNAAKVVQYAGDQIQITPQFTLSKA